MEEYYCALCGVPFGIATALYHGRVGEDDVAWTAFYRLCLSPLVVFLIFFITHTVSVRRYSGPNDSKAADEWYISGVGWTLNWDHTYAPPPSYDARSQKREQLEATTTGDRCASYMSQ